MGLQCGIVGLPNVGKSTLFNAITKAQIEAQNYPFCTIEPNVGIVAVPDARLNQLADIVNPEKILPTTMEFVDIAGLVRGASKGEGLGNKFLSHIRETNAVLHVVRCFEDTDIIHVENKIDPVSDLKTIQTELLLADISTVEKAVAKLSKNTKSGDKQAKLEFENLKLLLEHLNNENPASSFKLEYNLQLLTGKPSLILCNLDEKSILNPESNTHYQQLISQNNNIPIVPFCGKLEAEIADLDDSDKIEFLAEVGLQEPGLNRIIHASYKLLNLQSYFTAGKKEVRAWPIKVGTTAPEAAGVIHSDFAKGFIRAEVISFQDFIDNKGEAGAKQAGKWRLEGKDYIVQDGDVMHFRFNI